VRNIIILSWIVLMIASVFPADARGQRYARHNGKHAAQTTHTGKSIVGDKASADTDDAMDKRIKSICRGC
jgi:hypothetical protein